MASNAWRHMAALVLQTRLIKNGRFSLASVLDRCLDQLKLFFYEWQHSGCSFPFFSQQHNMMNLFSNAFMKAPKAKGEAFQRSDVVPKETTTIKNNWVYCCIAGQERMLKNQSNIKSSRFIYWQIILVLPEKIGNCESFVLLAGRGDYRAGKKSNLSSIFIQQSEYWYGFHLY